MAPQVVHVRVHNLAPTVTLATFQRTLEGLLPNGEPIVFPLITDPNTNTKHTTVCFTAKTKRERRKIIKRIRESNQKIIDDSSSKSYFGFDPHCLGLIILRNDHVNPDFDICFVHGFGGHALKTWSSKVRNHKDSKIWPRDFLPERLDRPELHGRYMTYGHDSGPFNRGVVPDSILRIAEDLLYKLIEARGRGCSRPLYFVCHSLGGLIACQAILLAIANDKNQAQTEFQQAFTSEGQCTIKGVTFFGTPFRGSKLAQTIAFISKAIPAQNFMNVPHLSFLSVRNRDVEHIVDKFVIQAKNYQIGINIFFERIPLRKGPLKTLIVVQDSAEGKFGSMARRRGLRLDHRDLVKFTGPEDENYRDHVAPAIENMVHGTVDYLKAPEIPKINVEWDSLAPQIRLTNQSVGHPKSTSKLQRNVSSDHMPITMQEMFSPLHGSSLELAASESLSQLEARLGKIPATSNKAAPGTCQWILDKPKFKEWLYATTNKVLVIEGGAGYGKSVLAEYILQHLQDNYGFLAIDPGFEINSPIKKPGERRQSIITYYISDKTEEIQTADNILQDLLAQIARAHPLVVKEAMKHCWKPSNSTAPTKLYWNILTYIRRTIKSDIFCVIDGLDECVQAPKSARQTTPDSKMVGFLRKVCQLEEENQQKHQSNMKILFVTQPKPEINMAIESSSIKLVIGKDDVSADVLSMIRWRIQNLAERREINEDLQNFIIELVARKCSPIFQMAHQLLKALAAHSLESRESISILVNEFRSDKLENMYEGMLSRIQQHHIAQAGRLIKIVFFASCRLTMNSIKQALAINFDDLSPEEYQQKLSSNLLGFLSSSEIGSLVKIDESDEAGDRPVVFDHPSVERFFQQLPEGRLGCFTCADQRAGHLLLARLCMHHLLLYRHLTVPKEVVKLYPGNESMAKLIHFEFAYYATVNWTFHARRAGELMGPYLELVDKLMFSDAADYVNMCFIRHLHSHIDEDTMPKFKPLAQDEFLALHGLRFLLPIVYLPINERFNFQNYFRILMKKQRKTTTKQLTRLINLPHRETGRRVLHYAAIGGDVETIEYLLECGAVGKVEDEDYETPFFQAVEAGNTEAAELLIARGHGYESNKHPKGLLPLHFAVMHGMHNVAAAILHSQPKLDPNESAAGGWTSVLIAAQSGNVQILKDLLRRGGDLNKAKDRGSTPLLLAVREGHLDAVRELFKFDASLNPAPKTQELLTPAHAAAQNGYLEILKLLCEKGASMEPDETGWYPIHFAASSGHHQIIRYLAGIVTAEGLNRRTDSGRHSLHLAADGGHLEVVKYFIEDLNIDYNTECDDRTFQDNIEARKKITSVTLAASSGHFEIVEYLWKKGASLQETDSTGATLLHQSAYTESLQLSEFLVKNGVDPFARTEIGVTAFHIAAANNNTPLVKAYLDGTLKQGSKENFDINETTNDKESALYLSIRSHAIPVAKTLIEHKADPNIEISGGSTALIAATMVKDTELIEILIKNGANVDHVDHEGWSALCAAATVGRPSVVKLLIQHVTEIDTVGRYGRTPLTEAAAHYRVDAFTELINGGAKSIFLVDRFGRSAFDYVRHHEAFQHLVTEWKDIDRSEQDKMREKILRQVIYDDLTDFLAQAELKKDSYAVSLALGTAFICLGDFESARICFEQHVRKRSNGEPQTMGWFCDICFQEVPPGVTRMCKMCLDYVICSKCYDLDNDARPSNCSSDHEYLELGGESWQKLEINAVTTDGLTFKQWATKKLKCFSPPNTNETTDIVETIALKELKQDGDKVTVDLKSPNLEAETSHASTVTVMEVVN